jgi:geranylgeranyl pyrophosphate synthase
VLFRSESKRTLAVIHTLEKASLEDRRRLLEILNMHTQDQKLRNEAINLMKRYHSIEYVKETAQNMVKESWEAVEGSLMPSDAKEKMKAFAEYLIERKI